jgi:hypothetical protein
VNEVVAGLNTAASRKIKRKLLDHHTLIDQTAVEQAWPVAIKAMTEGALEPLGVARRDDIIGAPVPDGDILYKVAESILRYRHVLANDMSTLDDPGVFDLLALGLTNLERPTGRWANSQRLLNLRDFLTCASSTIHSMTRFAALQNFAIFRKWLSALTADSDIELIREFVDAFLTPFHANS